MPIVRAHLSIEQGCTFRQSILCDLSDHGVADIQTWPAFGPIGTVSLHRFRLYAKDPSGRGIDVPDGYVSVSGNTLTLTLTKEATERLPRDGTFDVIVSNGTDTFTAIAGAWQLRRSAWSRTELQAGFEDLDGLPVDLAAVYDATSSAGLKRVFVAHGRRRSAVRVSDGKRMVLEDRTFHAAGIGLNEALCALEIDDAAALLYTLTEEEVLYCESIADQTNPTEAKPPLDLSAALAADELVTDLAGWHAPGEKVLVVVTNRRLITIDPSGPTLVVKGATERVSPALSERMSDTNPTAALSINPLAVIELQRAKLGKDGDGKLVAFTRCACLGYELSPTTRPFAQVLVAADLDLAGAFVAPKFRQDTGVFTFYTFYNPFPVAPSGWAAFVAAGGTAPDGSVAMQKVHFHVWDYQWFDSGATKRIVVSHGRRNQVRKLDVTHTFTTGWTVGAILVCHPDFATDPFLAKDLHHVNVDPTNVNHLLVAEFFSRDGWRVINGDPPTSINVLLKTLSGRGVPRDHVAIAIAGAHFVVWNAEGSAVDYQLRAIDGSTNTPTALFEKGWFFNSDGIVAWPGKRTIYQLTFGGVMPYQRTGANGEWLPNDDGYQPARVDNPLAPGTSWYFTNTELIDFVEDVAAPGDHRLLVACAAIGMMEFRIDPLTGHPEPARLSLIPPSDPHPDFPGWPLFSEPGEGTYYSNDVTWARIDGELFALLDFTNRARSEWAAIALRYDRASDAWVYHASRIVPSGFPPYLSSLTSHVRVMRDLGSRFLLVHADAALLVFRLTALVTRRVLELDDLRYTTDFAPASQAAGCDSAGSRVFVALNNPGGVLNTSCVLVFDLDPVTGKLAWTRPVQQLKTGDFTMPAGHTWVKTFNVRYRRLSAERGLLHVATASGVVIELEYDTRRLAPLRYRSSWKSDYDNVLCDCRTYDFGDGPQLLVSKNIEGFAIVSPTE